MMRIEIFKVGDEYGVRRVYFFGLIKGTGWFDLTSRASVWHSQPFKRIFCLGTLAQAERVAQREKGCSNPVHRKYFKKHVDTHTQIVHTAFYPRKGTNK